MRIRRAIPIASGSWPGFLMLVIFAGGLEHRFLSARTVTENGVPDEEDISSPHEPRLRPERRS